MTTLNQQCPLQDFFGRRILNMDSHGHPCYFYQTLTQELRENTLFNVVVTVWVVPFRDTFFRNLENSTTPGTDVITKLWEPPHDGLGKSLMDYYRDKLSTHFVDTKCIGLAISIFICWECDIRDDVIPPRFCPFNMHRRDVPNVNRAMPW